MNAKDAQREERGLVLSWAVEVEFCWITVLLTQQMPLFEEKDSQDLHQTIPTSTPYASHHMQYQMDLFTCSVVVAIINIKHIFGIIWVIQTSYHN